MPNLSETIGSLLSDIAAARARSDAFTREISQEYLRDPLMRLMPVPRAEIRGVELELSFAVSSAQSQPVDSKAVARRIAGDEHTALSSALLNIEPARPRAAQPSTHAALFQPAIRDRAHAVLQARLKALLSTEIQPEQWLDADPALFAKLLARKVEAALAEAATESGATLPAGTSLQTPVDAIVREWAGAARARLQSALDRAKANSLALALAVTKDELAGVAPAAVARIKLQVEIQNLEWIDAPDADGTPGNKLITR